MIALLCAASFVVSAALLDKEATSVRRPRVTCAESTHPAGMAEPQALACAPNSQAHSAGSALHRSVTGLQQHIRARDLKLKVGQSIIEPGACPIHPNTMCAPEPSCRNSDLSAAGAGWAVCARLGG